jgi:ankyrin repeat domain-containing protein 50
MLRASHVALTDSKRRYVCHFEETFRVNIGDRVEGTCSWSLSSHQYQSWQNDQNATVLWITGDAGCGKTTLASFLVDNLQTLENYEHKEKYAKPLVSCFFCSKDIRSQGDARSVLRGLILQILTSRQSLIAKVRSKFGSFKREFDQSFESLWKIFTFSLEAVRCDRLYVVIEALDECQTESRKKLLSNISSILKSWNDSVSPSLKQLKFLITAQPQIMTSWRAITGSSAQYHLKIEDRPQGMVQDVLRFINKNVDELVSLRRCTESFANDLRKSLHKLAENSFLWVSLVLDHIKATIELSILDLPRIFSQIPKDLRDAYSSYLPSVAPHNVSSVRRYVSLLVASSRPLTLDEVGTLANLGRDKGRTLSESVSASVTKKVWNSSSDPSSGFLILTSILFTRQ